MPRNSFIRGKEHSHLRHRWRWRYFGGSVGAWLHPVRFLTWAHGEVSAPRAVSSLATIVLSNWSLLLPRGAAQASSFLQLLLKINALIMALWWFVCKVEAVLSGRAAALASACCCSATSKGKGGQSKGDQGRTVEGICPRFAPVR